MSAHNRAIRIRLLSWFDAMIATLRECPEIGVGVCPVLDGHRPAWR
jgi:hypothetical protein